MAEMSAMLKIKAVAEGEGAVAGMARAVLGLNRAAESTTKGLKNLAQSAGAGGLAGAFSKLMPLFSVGGLLAMAKSTIEAGDAFHDMSQRTGVSVEMLARFKRAASLSGTSIEAVEKGLVRLSRNMAAAAQGSSVGDSVARDLDRAVAAVKQGEQQQIDAVERAADRRVAALERESDRRLREIGRRYRNEQRILDDSFSDEQDREEQAIQDRINVQVKAIQREFDARRRAIERTDGLTEQAREAYLQQLQDGEDAAVERVRQGGREQTKALSRSLRDQQQARQDALDDRRQKEEQVIRDQIKSQADSIKASTKIAVEGFKAAADAREKALKGADKAELSQQMEELGLSGKAASEAFRQLGVSVVDSNGNLRQVDDVMLDVADALVKLPDAAKRVELAQKLLGKSGFELIPMFMEGSKAIRGMSVSMTSEFAAAADQYNDQLTQLGGKVGKLSVELAVKLLPSLIKITDSIMGLVDAFNSMPGWAKSLLIGTVVLGATWKPLAMVIFGVVEAIKTLVVSLKFLQLVGYIAFGWLPEIVIPLLSGFIAWVGGTFIPALVAFFSGPVGWTVLAIAAVVAMCVFFREPIGKFLAWLGGALSNALKVALAVAYQVFVQPFVFIWDAVLRKPITALWSWLVTGFQSNMQRAADFIRGIWEGMINGLRSIVNGFMSGWVGLMNNAANGINQLIASFNRVSPIKVALVPTLAVPKFASGAYVTGSTFAQIGEGGEPEYVIPSSKMGAASANYQQGRRGADVLNSRPTTARPMDAVDWRLRNDTLLRQWRDWNRDSLAWWRDQNRPSEPPAFRRPTINISTGPVMQQGDIKYVTMDDLKSATSQVVDQLRSPLSRQALGVG